LFILWCTYSCLFRRPVAMITREAAERLCKDVLNNLYSPAHL